MTISPPGAFSILSLTRPNQTYNVLALDSSPSKSQLERAALYLVSMYNPTLGLVANSEDRGPNPLGREGVPCNNTYWVYSDNLWAGWALQPFNPSIAENITKTVQWYMARYGRSMLFEAAIGEPIPTTIHASKTIKVFDEIVDGSRLQVLLDRHQYADNPGVFHDAEDYADLCWYMTLNYWMMGDIGASMHWFRTGERLWNYTTKKGFYDKAARNDGRYQNFKLGLPISAESDRVSVEHNWRHRGCGVELPEPFGKDYNPELVEWFVLRNCKHRDHISPPASIQQTINQQTSHEKAPLWIRARGGDQRSQGPPMDCRSMAFLVHGSLGFDRRPSDNDLYPSCLGEKTQVPRSTRYEVTRSVTDWVGLPKFSET